MAEHTEHVTIEDGLTSYSCLYGNCEHGDEDSEDSEDWSACPKITVEVCIQCMDNEGYGRTPGDWADYEVGLIAWPCEHQPASRRDRS